MYRANENNSAAIEETTWGRFKANMCLGSIWTILTKSIGDLFMSYGAVLLAFFVRRVANLQVGWFELDNSIITNVLITIAFAILLARQKLINNFNHSHIENIFYTIALLVMILYVIASVSTICDWVLIKSLMNIGIILSIIICFLSNIDLNQMEIDKKSSESRKKTTGKVGDKNFKL